MGRNNRTNRRNRRRANNNNNNNNSAATTSTRNNGTDEETVEDILPSLAALNVDNSNNATPTAAATTTSARNNGTCTEKEESLASLTTFRKGDRVSFVGLKTLAPEIEINGKRGTVISLPPGALVTNDSIYSVEIDSDLPDGVVAHIKLANIVAYTPPALLTELECLWFEGEVDLCSCSLPCYHGSNRSAFRNWQYREIALDYMRYGRSAQKGTKLDRCAPLDEDFCKYLFAVCARGFLVHGVVPGGKRNNPHMCNMHILLDLAIRLRYGHLPEKDGKDVGFGTEYFEKRNKYIRDLITTRGFINVLYRETGCGCLKDMKKEEDSKTTIKMAHCFGCSKEFPKETMFLCGGCKCWNYCSTECQLKHWRSGHKDECIRLQTNTNAKPNANQKTTEDDKDSVN